MGKVSEESISKAVATNAGKPSASKSAKRGALAAFFSNLTRADRYKPTQGKHARLWTAVGLAAIVLAGVFQLYNYYLTDLPVTQRSLIPVAIVGIAAWIIWRIVEYPPFADFLIATEAEMNKVSWTSKQDLIRATIVVLVTVLLLSLFLFGVDFIWVILLKFIGVLQDYDISGFGSQAG